jgi:hypothetical protein
MGNPTEEVHKTIHEQAEKTHDPGTMKIALSSALIAVLAASASFLSEHQSNEAMLDQLKASDNWSYYQAKGIKSMIIQNEMTTLKAVNKAVDANSEMQVENYSKEQKEISTKATEQEQASAKHFAAHNIMSYAENFLEIAIGISAISALLRRRWLWFTSLAVTAGGIIFFVYGIHLITLIK